MDCPLKEASNWAKGRVPQGTYFPSPAELNTRVTPITSVQVHIAHSTTNFILGS